ncbi:hypothetical protein ACFY71_11105 [Streptomyces cinerochromogenes]|uniref:hypothetical protein n=1 Tax=Streptomyces cinerochromogenes TaxID=66422 RepID=UPI00369329D4
MRTCLTKAMTAWAIPSARTAEGGACSPAAYAAAVRLVLKSAPRPTGPLYPLR